MSYESAITPRGTRRIDPAVVALVTAARHGDQTAWDEIVERYSPLVWAISKRYPLSQPDADNVAQTLWLLLIEQLSKLQDPATLPGWIATTTAQECLRVINSHYEHAEEPATQAVSSLRARARVSVTGFSAGSLTNLAALLAGRENGPALLDEWRAHLAGETGHDPANLAKVWVAIGFVIAALRDRGQDWADAAWRPVDAVLRSRFLSGLFVVISTIVDAAIVLQYRGPVQVLISFSSIFGAGVALSLAVKTGRKYRDVQPPERKPRRTGTGGSDGPEDS